MSKNEKILAIDPGERVGWAVGLVWDDTYTGELTPDPMVMTPAFTVGNHGISGLKDFAVKLHEAAATYDTIVYESWRLYPGHARSSIGSDMQTSQLIGMIRLAAWLNPKVKLKAYNATVKKTARKTAPKVIEKIIDKEPKAHDDAHNVDALLLLWHYYWESYV